MRHTRTALAAGFAALIVPATIDAQDHRFGAGYHAGAVWFSPLNPDAQQVGGETVSDIELAPGWVAGLQFENWFGSGRAGGRIGAAFTTRNLSIPGEADRDVDVWMLDAAFMLRLLGPHRLNVVAPYIVGGAGLVGYGLRSDVETHIPAGAVYDGDNDARFAPMGGIGFDILTGWRWDDEPIGIRIEATDHVMLESPFRDIETGDRLGMIHNIRVTLGLFTGFGVLR
jgi:hypothetical protein